ncbi:Remorin [Vigna unguiculata]|uniref:Remorin n=1 Tax=Vigna unguiculata TaxID=3917 RepID=A0A4D6LUD3_VIGUN|nr:Remorin [Vigna unguiculata]
MGEEVSNKTQPELLHHHPLLVDSVPPLQEKESDKNDPPNQNLDSPSPLLQKVEDHAAEKDSEDSVSKGDSLAYFYHGRKVKRQKQRTGKAYKKHSAVELWEDSKKTSIEAELKKIEENLERKKAEYVEKMKNKVAEIHRLAEEKRACVDAQKSEEFLEVEETAAKFRSRGVTPRKFFSCFSP